MVDKRVQVTLGRDTPNWRILNACPACTYKLEGEAKLIFEELYTMDGNDSLKRILRRGSPPPQVDGEEPVVAPSSEHMDSREGGGDYFLSREKVDVWAKVVLEGMLAGEDDVSELHHLYATVFLIILQEGEEYNPCADRWKNMTNDITAKMWGIFDETGIFLALCRHGFVLIIADMIRSGELYVS
jgi:hypothetical protein